MVLLKKMDASEFDQYIPRLIKNYAADLSENLELTYEAALEKSQEQISDLLAQGVETTDHYLFTVTQPEGENLNPVGILWVWIDPQRSRAFIYDIEIEADRRGAGLGRQTLAAMEAWLRGLKIRRVELNVFGNNPAAAHLYESQGFTPFSINMRKVLD